MSNEPSTKELVLAVILIPTIMGLGIGLFAGTAYLIFSYMSKLL